MPSRKRITDYIAEQPAAVVACIGVARSWAERWRPTSGVLHLVGSGSSRNAILAAAPSLAAARRGALMIHGPAQFVADCRAGLITPGDVIVLSQSGASVTSVEAASAARQAGCDVVAITAEPDSPLAATGVPMLLMPIGPELVGPKTKGFTASLATLLALAGIEGDLGPSLEACMHAAREQAESLLDGADRADMILVSGSGALDGIALEASLKIAEIAGVPTASFPWEEVLHGRLHGLTSRSLCVVLVQDAATRAEALRASAAMRKRQVAVEVVDTVGDLASPWSLLAAILPFQWLAIGLAERRGMQPETMRYPGLSADLAIKTSDVE